MNTADLGHLAGLMESCFGKPVPSAYFQWKYLDNPAGKLTGFEAWHQGRLAGFYGVIPERYRIGGGDVIVYQAMDLMTHPDFQRQGVFGRLGKATYDAIANEQGLLIAIGVPNYHILPGHLKLGSIHIHSFPYVFVSRRYWKIRRLLASRPRVRIEPVTDPAKDLGDYFSRRSPSPSAVAPVYSPEFLRWRLLDHPLIRYSLFSIAEEGRVVGLYAREPTNRGRCRLMLIDFASAELHRRLLPAVLDHTLESTGCGSAFTWRPTNRDLDQASSAAGMLRNPLSRGPYSFRFPFFVRTSIERHNGVDLADIANYDLQPIIQD